MIQVFSFSNTEEELRRFQDAGDMRTFAAEHGCAGVELQMVEELQGSFLEAGLVKGIHLTFWNSWLDMWRGNSKAVLAEYGDFQTAEDYYGGTGRIALIHKLRKELDTAQKMGAQYVVFHVSEVTIAQSYHRQFVYSDEEVVDTACELINHLLDGQNYTFDFLMENLWWPGLNLLHPQTTKRLLDGVHYEKKGIMFDTGHLMNTNLDLKDQREAVAYIFRILEEHRELLPYFKGVHLNASLSGEYVKRSMKQKPDWAENYWERWGRSYRHIFRVDQHHPFTDAGVHDLIEYISPEYITHEVISISRKELGDMIDLQQKALKGERE